MADFILLSIPHCCKKSTTDPYNCFYEGPWCGAMRTGYHSELDYEVEFQYQYRFYRATVPRCHVEQRRYSNYSAYRCVHAACIEYLAGYEVAQHIYKEYIFQYPNQHPRGMVIESTQRMNMRDLYYFMPEEKFLGLDLSDYYLPNDYEDEELKRAYENNVSYLSHKYGLAFRQLTDIEKVIRLHKAFKRLIHEARQHQTDF